ncbi:MULTISPECIES: thiamine phosphate synthase [unclassified Lentimonas]|uniref:thiamine phosphate synthase n=1 Tax=unclassified Lentimonas TaxID=2630993 RepID=UPI001321DD0E|nr:MULTISPECIES: thiamine phosphate synthase [unclassified Lentimonas]CAA6680091.1 Unannotated [Lentimonas sp. CC4]CAA6685071.1 Unannotated [Lentimonas sp. CC6]CAA6691434.1 Unannotated [Lentimonas sp. CC10]CAA6693172.1 Unannotated [Lentimonas sp. CC19]CAA7068946.1 Unannotated [Lentimonas sp. CC11]
MFEWLAVSPEADYPEEAFVIERLLDAGLCLYHVRKPGWTLAQCESLLEQLPQWCRGRVVIHEHYSLVAEYMLAGCHMKDRLDAVELRSRWHAPSMSRSLHRISDLDTDMSGWNYGFLSPIFPSLTKVGYTAPWTLDQLQQALLQYAGASLYALGGVDAGNCAVCADLGFAGAVLHGALWLDDAPIKQFNEIKRTV